MVAPVLGDHGFERFDGTFDHGVVRLANGDALEPKPGSGNDTGYKIVVPPREFDEFVTDAHHKRDQQDSHQHAQHRGQDMTRNSDGNRVDEKGNEDAHQHH